MNRKVAERFLIAGGRAKYQIRSKRWRSGAERSPHSTYSRCHLSLRFSLGKCVLLLVADTLSLWVAWQTDHWNKLLTTADIDQLTKGPDWPDLESAYPMAFSHLGLARAP